MWIPLNTRQVTSTPFDPLSSIPIFEEPYVFPLFYDMSFISDVLTRLTSVLTSRFLIHLQNVKRRLAGSSRSISQMSDLAFRPHTARNMDGFIGSLGAQLSFYGDDTGEDEEEEF